MQTNAETGTAYRWPWNQRRANKRLSWAIVTAACGMGFVSAGADEPDIAARIAAVKGEYDGADRVVVLDDTEVVVDDVGIGANTQTRVVKVLKESAANGEAVRRWGFDPATNTLVVKAVRLHKADGKVEEIDVAKAVTQPAPAGIIFWGTMETSIEIPGVEVGDSVETVHVKTGFNTAYLDGSIATAESIGSLGGDSRIPNTLPSPPLAGREADSGLQTTPVFGGEMDADGSNPHPALSLRGRGSNSEGGLTGGGGCSLQPPMPGHWYDVMEWQESVPVLEKRYSVRIARSKPLQYQVINGELTTTVRFEGDRAIYTFSKKDVPMFKGEPRMVSGGDVSLKLVLATLDDWHQKARWFHDANEPSFKTDGAIKTKVRELVEGVSDDEEKIRILNHWVAENVRYVGTTRGAHEGYTTHAAIETFHDRGGVCKDKAGLLVAMLREAGFDSYIVMTMAGARVEQTPADQFNHAVTSIRNADGTFRLLDPTWMPKNREMWSSAEQLQAVVYGTPEGESGLQLSPYSGPEENHTTWSVESTIRPDGDLAGHIQLVTLGCPETNLRRGLAGIRPMDRKGRFEESLRPLAANAVLESFSVTDPTDFSGPAILNLKFAAEGYALGHDGRRYFRLPSLSGVLADLVLPDIRDSAETKAGERKYPLKLRSTRRFLCREVVRLPDGWKAVKLPEASNVDGPAASLEFGIETIDGRLEFHLAMDVKKHVVPVEDYDKFKQVIDRFSELGKTYIVCELEKRSASVK